MSHHVCAPKSYHWSLISEKGPLSVAFVWRWFFCLLIIPHQLLIPCCFTIHRLYRSFFGPGLSEQARLGMESVACWQRCVHCWWRFPYVAGLWLLGSWKTWEIWEIPAGLCRQRPVGLAWSWPFAAATGAETLEPTAVVDGYWRTCPSCVKLFQAVKKLSGRPRRNGLPSH